MKRILRALLKTILFIIFITLEILLIHFFPYVALTIFIGIIFFMFYERG